MSLFKTKFDKDLEISYDLVGNEIYKRNNLSKDSLKNSINFFTKKSLKLKRPEPINVDVYGLVSGLPFSKNTIESIFNIVSGVKNILK